MIEFLVEEFAEGFAEHFEDGFDLVGFHLLLDEDAEFLYGLFGVFFKEVFHVEFENVFVLGGLFFDDLIGKLADFRHVGLKCQDPEFDVLFEAGLVVDFVLDQHVIDHSQNQHFGIADKR